jgi:hypothetical protein
MAIGMILFGVVAGIFPMIAANRLLGSPPSGWLRRLLRAPGSKPESRYLQRATAAITQRFHASMWLAMAPVVATGLFLTLYIISVWLSTGNVEFTLMLGFLGGVAASYPFLLHLQLPEFRKKVSGIAARQLARIAKPEDAGTILLAASTHSDPLVRLAAVAGLRELGTNSGVEALRKLSDDKNHEVAVQARDAMSDLLPVLKGEAMLSVRTMETYVQEHQFLQKNLKSSNADKAVKAFDKLHEITLQIDEIVYSQLAIRRSYPDVYCVDCYSRAEDLRYEEWEWVRCKQCKEVHGLKAGVQKVVGQIGGEAVDGGSVLQAGVLRVNLWDQASLKGGFGEVDVLEVVGGKAINYDWAVSAVIEKMHNHLQGPANRISVKLIGNPALEVNTLHLLRTLDPGMMA